jgi:hypothetical protein
MTDKPRSTATPTRDPNRALAKTRTAIAVQNPTRPAIGAPRAARNTITNQRTPQQHLSGRIQHTKHPLLNALQPPGISRLRTRIRLPRTLHRLRPPRPKRPR